MENSSVTCEDLQITAALTDVAADMCEDCLDAGRDRRR
jgi:hypothetical protein